MGLAFTAGTVLYPWKKKKKVAPVLLNSAVPNNFLVKSASVMNALQIVFVYQRGYMILNLTFLSFWLVPTIWVRAKKKIWLQMLPASCTSSATSTTTSVDGDEKNNCCYFQVTFFRSSQNQWSWLRNPTEAIRELISSMVSPVWGPLKVVLSFRNYTRAGQLGWKLVRRGSTGCILLLRSV